MNINIEKELENVSGGTPYANGSFTENGKAVVYTVAAGDTLIGIGEAVAVIPGLEGPHPF